MSKSVKAILAELGACPEAVAWVGRKTPRRAWDTCERADWMLWIAERLNIDRKLLTFAAKAAAWEAAKAAARAAAWAAAGAARAAARAEWAAARAAAGDARAAARAAAWAVRAAEWAAAGAAAWYAALKDMANIVREIIPFSVVRKAIADYEGKE